MAVAECQWPGFSPQFRWEQVVGFYSELWKYKGKSCWMDTNKLCHCNSVQSRGPDIRIWNKQIQPAVFFFFFNVAHISSKPCEATKDAEHVMSQRSRRRALSALFLIHELTDLWLARESNAILLTRGCRCCFGVSRFAVVCCCVFWISFFVFGLRFSDLLMRFRFFF